MESTSTQTSRPRVPWNKGKLLGQKAPFKRKEIWAIRVWLQLEHRTRELALFDLGLDSKLRSCDLVKLRVRDGGRVQNELPEPAEKVQVSRQAASPRTLKSKPIQFNARKEQLRLSS